jgi:hypothetical protein
VTERDPTPTDELEHIVRVADTILSQIKSNSVEQVPVHDVNDAILCAAFGRAYRCFRSIRELAGRGEADDAFVLTRSLVSIVARALWLVAPDDDVERERRFNRGRRSWAEWAAKTGRDMASEGLSFGVDPARAQALVDRLDARGIPSLPDDRSMLDSVGLTRFYPRVHRVASDVVHFSLGAALEGFLERPDVATRSGGTVSLEKPDRDRAAEALTLAAIVFAAFLRMIEPRISHGAGETAIQELFVFVETHGDPDTA